LEHANGSRLYYEGMGFRMGWDRWFLKTDAMLDQARGSALQAAIATRLGGVGLWAQHARLNEFQSEVFQPVFGTIRSRTGARLDLELRRTDWPRLPVSLEWCHDDLARGSVDQVRLQVSIAGGILGL